MSAFHSGCQLRTEVISQLANGITGHITDFNRTDVLDNESVDVQKDLYY